MEEQNSPSTMSTGIKWGLIAGLASIILFIAIDFSGQVGNKALSSIGFLVSIALLILAHREYKSDGDGFMEYGQGVGIGFWMGAVSAFLSSSFTYLYVTIINPAYMDTIKDIQQMEMEKRGMSDAQIEQAMEMSGFFTGPLAMFIFGLLGGVLITVILSLIVSAFTKKGRPEMI
ncbi:MAG: DUF4199 domain-containing protein [Cyclobacteriaceae bacterium]|nr:DUF4199 domain-containing protein [Cyclobacteriaceae bacterium]